MLFINPYHALYYELIYRTGVGGLFENWRSTLAEVASANSVALIDFSGYSSFSTELFNLNSWNSKILKWFWEPAHFREELGNLMLLKMLGGRKEDTDAMNNFGIQLDSELVRTAITQFRNQRMRFLSDHKEIESYLEDIISRARSDIPLCK